MPMALASQIEAQVTEAAKLYHRLVLVAGINAEGKSAAFAKLAPAHGWSHINVSLTLAARLLELAQRHRAVRCPLLTREITDGAGGDVVMLDHIELLFSPDLAQDPLRLLQGLSRNRIIIASWPGPLVEGSLQYAEPGHSEYKHYRDTDAILLDARGLPAFEIS